jgi:LysM repeat protein
MDTISRENNSMLPVGGIIVGVIGLLLGGFGLVQASKANKAVEAIQPKIEKIDAIETTANQAADAAQKTAKRYDELRASTQAGFDQVGPAIGNLQASITKLEDAMKKPAPVAEKGKKGGEAPVAGPGEYVVRSGDSGMKIASANKVALADLQAVNPGVNWNKLAPGQKIKLPAKK